MISLTTEEGLWIYELLEKKELAKDREIDDRYQQIRSSIFSQINSALEMQDDLSR
jgi:hypothetical protein